MAVSDRRDQYQEKQGEQNDLKSNGKYEIRQADQAEPPLPVAGRVLASRFAKLFRLFAKV